MYNATACSIACCCSFPKKPTWYYCPRVQTNWRYTDSGPAEPKILKEINSSSVVGREPSPSLDFSLAIDHD